MSRKLPLSYVGGLGPIPPIDSLDSPGLGLRQAYSVSIAQGNAKARRSAPAAGGPVERRAENDSELRVPARAGGCQHPGRRHSRLRGQRHDPFFIDLGAVIAIRDRAAPARERRPTDLETADVLVWALGRNGHCGDALGHSKRALGLGTWDAPSFHRG